MWLRSMAGSMLMSSQLHSMHLWPPCHSLVSRLIEICEDIFFLYAHFFSSYIVVFSFLHVFFFFKCKAFTIPWKNKLNGVILCFLLRLSAVNEHFGWWNWRYMVCIVRHAVRTEGRFKMPHLYVYTNILHHWLMQMSIVQESYVCECGCSYQRGVCMFLSMHAWEFLYTYTLCVFECVPHVRVFTVLFMQACAPCLSGCGGPLSHVRDSFVEGGSRGKWWWWN